MTRAKFPPGLGARGRRLWAAVTTARGQLGPGEAVLLEEAARLSDRLDRLDDAVSGGVLARWVEEDPPEDGVREYRLVVNSALSEARLTTTALRGVLESLGLERAAKDTQPTVKVGDPVDDIAARRAARRSSGA